VVQSLPQVDFGCLNTFSQGIWSTRVNDTIIFFACFSNATLLSGLSKRQWKKALMSNTKKESGVRRYSENASGKSQIYDSPGSEKRNGLSLKCFFMTLQSFLNLFHNYKLQRSRGSHEFTSCRYHILICCCSTVACWWIKDFVVYGVANNCWPW